MGESGEVVFGPVREGCSGLPAGRGNGGRL
jgi:hypothetical protein